MAFIIPKKTLIAIVLVAGIFIFGTAGYMVIEKWGFTDSLYMTVITITTVGFGEVKPLSHSGRIFTIFLILNGFAVLTYGAKLAFSFLMEGELGQILRRRKMEKQIDKMKDHYIVCAKGETGEYVIEEFAYTKRPLVVVTLDKEIAEKTVAEDILTIFDNPAEDEVLEKAGITRAKGLITVLDEDKDNLFVVLSAKGMNPNAKIVTQAIDKKTVKKLKKAGADEVVLTDAIGGMRIASAMLRPTVVSFLDSMLRDSKEPLRVEEVTVMEGSSIANLTLEKANITLKTGLGIVAISKQSKDKYIYNPGYEYELLPGDTLIVIGNPEQVQKLEKLATP